MRVSAFRALILASLVAAPTFAAAQQSTVDGYTPAEAAKARAAAQAAGYTPGVISMAQAGDLFINATRGGEIYSLTVSPDGQVFASTSTP